MGTTVRVREPLPVGKVDELLKSMLVLAYTVHRVLEREVVAASVDEPLSASQAQALRLVGHHGGQTSSQVANFLGVTKAAVSQLADSMAQSGLVRRRRGPHDRRESILELTPRGKRRFLALLRGQRHRVRTAAKLSQRTGLDEWTRTTLDMAAALAGADRAFKQFCLQCGAHLDGSCVLVGGDAKCPFLEHREGTGRRTKRRSVKD